MPKVATNPSEVEMPDPTTTTPDLAELQNTPIPAPSVTATVPETPDAVDIKALLDASFEPEPVQEPTQEPLRVSTIKELLDASFEKPAVAPTIADLLDASFDTPIETTPTADVAEPVDTTEKTTPFLVDRGKEALLQIVGLGKYPAEIAKVTADLTAPIADASVSGLNGIKSFIGGMAQGKSPKEALADMEESIASVQQKAPFVSALKGTQSLANKLIFNDIQELKKNERFAETKAGRLVVQKVEKISHWLYHEVADDLATSLVPDGAENEAAKRAAIYTAWNALLLFGPGVLGKINKASNKVKVKKLIEDAPEELAVNLRKQVKEGKTLDHKFLKDFIDEYKSEVETLAAESEFSRIIEDNALLINPDKKATIIQDTGVINMEKGRTTILKLDAGIAKDTSLMRYYNKKVKENKKELNKLEKKTDTVDITIEGEEGITAVKQEQLRTPEQQVEFETITEDLQINIQNSLIAELNRATKRVQKVKEKKAIKEGINGVSHNSISKELSNEGFDVTSPEAINDLAEKFIIKVIKPNKIHPEGVVKINNKRLEDYVTKDADLTGEPSRALTKEELLAEMTDDQLINDTIIKRNKNKEDNQAKKGFKLSDVKNKFIDTLFTRDGVWNRKFKDVVKVEDRLGHEYDRIKYAADTRAGATPGAQSLYGKFRKKIFADVTPKELEAFNTRVFYETIVRSEKIKPGSKQPQDIHAKGAEKTLEQLRKDDPVLQEKLDGMLENYYASFRELLTSLKDGGLITSEAFETMVARNNYSPKKFFDVTDPVGGKVTNSKGEVVDFHDSGIKKLDSGAIKAMEEDAALLLYKATIHIANRLFENRARLAIRDLALHSFKDNSFKMMKPTINKKTGFRDKPRPEKGFTDLKVFKDGQLEFIRMRDDVAKSWIGEDPLLKSGMAFWMRTILGVPVLKFFATGANPVFALKNLPKDLGLIMMTTQQYSKSTPVLMAQMAKDMSVVFHDAVTRTGSYTDAINEGMGMSTLAEQSLFTKQLLTNFKTEPIKTSLNAVQEVASYINVTSENLTRLMLRERAMINLEKGGAVRGKDGKLPIKDRRKATAIAREYLDFAQGSVLTKALDNGIPYINASTQAIRSLGKGLYKDPVRFVAHVAQLSAISSALYQANTLTNREGYEDIDPRIKAENWISMTPLYEKNERGQKEYFYTAVPKDQFIRVVTSVADFFTALSLGHEPDLDQTQEAVEQFMAITPSSAFSPAHRIILGMINNVDTFTNQQIVRGPDVDPTQEFDDNTNPATRKILDRIALATGGEKITLPDGSTRIEGGLQGSPQRIEHAMRQVFVPNNPFVATTGAVLQRLFDGVPEKEQDSMMEQLTGQLSPFRTILKKTNPAGRQIRELEGAKRSKNSQRKFFNRAFIEAMEEAEAKGNQHLSIEWIKKNIPVRDRKTFFSKRKDWLLLKDSPDKNFFISLRGIPRNMQAPKLAATYALKTEEERKRFDKDFRVLQARRRILQAPELKEFRELKKVAREAPAELPNEMRFEEGFFQHYFGEDLVIKGEDE